MWVRAQQQGCVLVAQVEPMLSGEATVLLRQLLAHWLDGLDAAGNTLPTTPVWVGFHDITAQPAEGGYEAVTPDFTLARPERTSDLTSALQLGANMLDVVRQAGAAGPEIIAPDRVILTRGWEQHEKLAMLRSEPRPRDSGWFVQPAGMLAPDGGWRAEHLESRAAWELLRTRPELVWAMRLPVGYAGIAEPGRIIEVVDANSRVVARDLTVPYPQRASE